MSIFSSETWSFRGQAFLRLNPGDDDPRWFPQTIARTVDVAAGDAGGSSRRWVDVGGREYGTLTTTAWCETSAGRDILAAYLGTSGALTGPGGRSGTALLVKADPLIADNGPYWRVALEFEYTG